MQTAIKTFIKLVSLPPATLEILAQVRQQKKTLRNRKFKIRERSAANNLNEQELL